MANPMSHNPQGSGDSLPSLPTEPVHRITEPLQRFLHIQAASGLVLGIGKPLGVVLACSCAVKLGLARLPDRVTWSAIIAGGFLAGIGFTMALFIAGLALDESLIVTAKVGILGASGLCAILGLVLLLRCLPMPNAA